MPNIIIKDEFGTEEVYENVNTVKFEVDGGGAASYRYNSGYIPDASYTGGLFQVKWIDYDGLLLKLMYVDEGDTVTADQFPTPPERDGYEFQEWTHTADDLTAVAQNTTIGVIRGWTG